MQLRLGYFSIPWNKPLRATRTSIPRHRKLDNTGLYTSALGDSFLRNIQNVQKRNGHTDDIASDAIAGIKEGLELLLDHFLGSSGAGQVMLQNGTKQVDTVMALEGVRFGNLKMAYAAFGMTIAILMATMIEAIKTKMWRDPLPVDFLDLKSIIVGVAKDTGPTPPGIKDWNGNAADRKVGMVEIMMRRDTTSLGFRQEKGWMMTK